MLSEGTQIIVNLVAGALLDAFLLLHLVMLVFGNEGDLRQLRTGRLATYLAGYVAIYVYVALLVLTIVYSPVEIRWWYMLAGVFGRQIVVGTPVVLLLDRRRPSTRHGAAKRLGPDAGRAK
jgi:hypothetical protein